MAKRKHIFYFLIFIIILLCMMNMYLQRQLNNTYIAYNTADRELAMLKMDYEKLYNAYYMFDTKMIKILEISENDYWATDSSAYIILNDSNVVFSFFKKPKMETEFHLWASKEKTTNSVYIDLGRVDTLKPHECFNKSFKENYKVFWVAERIEAPNGKKSSPQNISIISINE